MGDYAPVVSTGETYEPSMGFSPQAARLMRRAEQAAERFGQRAVCAEHLLLELLQEEHGPASQAIDLFADRGAMLDMLESALSAKPFVADAETKARRFEEARRVHEGKKRQAQEERRLFHEWLAGRDDK